MAAQLKEARTTGVHSTVKNDTKKYLKDLRDYSTLGVTISLSVLIGFGLGYWLDKYVFGTTPWCTMIFLGLGIAAGFRNILITIDKFKDK